MSRATNQPKQQLVFKLHRETELPQQIIDDAPASGRFDDYADYLLATFDVVVSLADTQAFLKSYGAWSAEELQDLEANKARLLWLACLDCKENNTNFFYMGD